MVPSDLTEAQIRALRMFGRNRLVATTTTRQNVVDALLDKGYIEKRPPKGLFLTDKGQAAIVLR